MLMPIAQSVEVAKGTVSLLQTILSGGPLLILSSLVIVMGFVIYKQTGRLATLEEMFRKSSESLLREQLEQLAPLTEALTQTRMALEGSSTKLEESSASVIKLDSIISRLEAHLNRMGTI